jgi:phosphoglucosamine mutase
MTLKQLFGTDGIRGVAGVYPLDRPTVARFGAALAEVLQQEHEGVCRVVLGRDTRESGVWLSEVVGRGLAARGVTAVDTGTITTPGLAHTLEAGHFHAGVMISASHNPSRDNGLKVFGCGGAKLSDELERRVERLILGGDLDQPSDDGPTVPEDPMLVRSYVEHLEGVISPPGRFGGLRLMLDCANGSACAIAPRVFRHHGAEVLTIGDAPDGENINLNCGSLHLDGLARAVREHGCDLGLAFDGDADRCLAVDRKGRRIDGDHILYIAGLRLHRAGRLRGAAVVATIMSNLWLEMRLREHGIALHRAPVGDKYVLERMIERDLVLGGEQSGHVIFREHAPTGDGILTGLLLLEALREDAQPVEAILDTIEPCPQLLLSVRVREKPNLRRHATVGPAVAEAERVLGDSGRVVLRYSGTEPVARIMVEGTNAETVRTEAERLARVVDDALGGG